MPMIRQDDINFVRGLVELLKEAARLLEVKKEKDADHETQTD